MTRQGKGFGLLEVLLALAILAISLGVITTGMVSLKKQQLIFTHYQHAESIAQEMLVEFYDHDKWPESNAGNYDQQYRWELQKVTHHDHMPEHITVLKLYIFLREDMSKTPLLTVDILAPTQDIEGLLI